eukprot:TRINITY_DN1272_c0_g2_i1.p1 TRINITY_DN1272_c0_g2~~TRINITY_DN1272_c0_g2_i1.p1  ORF type:complete len:311 (-),score=75.57 TRINITY_DN1272_c0_g2_i1:212-1144(-)
MGGCVSSPGAGEEIPLDFEGAASADGDVGTEVKGNLQPVPDILARLHTFKGCGEFIREAITNPNPETEEAAWKAVVPSVEILKGFYEFSLVIEKSMEKLLETLCTDDLDSNLQHQLGLAKLFAEVFDFVLRFDDAKMTNPAIQNDFSYYRRILNRIKLSNKAAAGVTVNDELANCMSLFFAYPTPMMNCLIKTTSNLMLQNDHGVTLENLSKFLSKMANSCFLSVEKQKFQKAETNMLCLRTVTGCIILYDHVHPKGAFHKKSPIMIRNAVTVIKNFKDENTDTLINAIRFNTVHLNDDDTPAPVKAALA